VIAKWLPLLLALACCASSNHPTRVKHFVKEGASRSQAYADYEACMKDAPIMVVPTAGPLIPCMAQRGYQFKPVWIRLPDASGRDSDTDDLECRQGRDVGHNHASTRVYLQCMNDRGWTYHPAH